MTLLEDLDAAEARLRLVMASAPGLTYSESVRQRHHADVVAASALCMAAAARCLVTTEDVSEAGPDAWRSGTIVDTPAGPVSLANVPAPRARDDIPTPNVDDAFAEAEAEKAARVRVASRFMADPLDAIVAAGAPLIPIATSHRNPIASHGIEEGRFGVVHWNAPDVKPLRIDLDHPHVRDRLDDRTSTAKPDPGAWER